MLKETLNEHAPFITKQIKRKPSPWITKELTKEMNTRDQLFRKARKTNKPSDWDVYKRKRNFIKNEVVRLKRNYFKQNLKKMRQNQTVFGKLSTKYIQQNRNMSR